MKRIITDTRPKDYIKQLVEKSGTKYYEGEIHFKDLIFEIHTGQTANSVMGVIPFSESFIANEAKNIISMAKEMFPYLIYKGTEKEKPNDSYIAFYNINNPSSRRIFVMIKDIYEKDDTWFIKNVFSKLGISNAAMSFCTYYKKSTKEMHLFSINALVVDIDCEKAGYVGNMGHYMVEEQLFDEHFGIDIPAPTFIEEGHNMRLIYVLDEPLYIANHKKSIDFVKLVMKNFADKLDYLGSDYQKINSYIRLEGSANTKGWKWKPTEVKIRKIGRKINFDSAVFEYMPEYNKNVNKKVKQKRNWSTDYKIHNKKILKFLKEVQKSYNLCENSGHREILCFLYRNYAYLYYEDSKKAEEELLEFNNGFNVPLTKKEALSSTNNINYRRYKYKNSSLISILNITDKKLLSLLSNTVDKKEYNKRYYEEHKTKNKKTERKRKTIKSVIIKMKNKSRKNSEIASELLKKGITLSIKSIERYITMFRKSGELVTA